MQSYSYKVNADQIAMKNNGKNLYSALPNKRTGTFIFLKPKFPPVRSFIMLVSHSVPSYSHIKTVN